MHASKNAAGARAPAAITVLVVLGLAAPLLGLLMIPVVAIGEVARAVAGGAGALGGANLLD